MILLSLLAALTQTGPALPVVLPTVANTGADATCGGRTAMTAIATCVATTQGAVEAAMEVYNADFERQGWLAADGRDNRIVYVRRKEGGGCDAFQVLAFAGQNTADPAGPAYLAFAVVPGDVCTATPASPVTPAS
jgi:hypothetical protein